MVWPPRRTTFASTEDQWMLNYNGPGTTMRCRTRDLAEKTLKPLRRHTTRLVVASQEANLGKQRCY